MENKKKRNLKQSTLTWSSSSHTPPPSKRNKTLPSPPPPSQPERQKSCFEQTPQNNAADDIQSNNDPSSSSNSSSSEDVSISTTDQQGNNSSTNAVVPDRKLTSVLWIDESGAQVEYVANFMKSSDATNLFYKLLSPQYSYQKHLMTLSGGKKVLSPRTGILFGAPKGSKLHQEYFSRATYEWIPEMLQLKKQVEDYLWQKHNEKHCFEFALVNRYDTGEDYIAWHSDREARGTPIASISMGAERNFKFKRIDNDKIVVSKDLRHGSLVIMKGTTQQLFKHTLTKTSKLKGQRLNITFRYA